MKKRGKKRGTRGESLPRRETTQLPDGSPEAVWPPGLPEAAGCSHELALITEEPQVCELALDLTTQWSVCPDPHRLFERDVSQSSTLHKAKRCVWDPRMCVAIATSALLSPKSIHSIHIVTIWLPPPPVHLVEYF